ncbi:O-methyltransferase [Wenyingzhuangia sp. IMCC45574]
MKNTEIKDVPSVYAKLEDKCKEIGFTMPSDLLIGTLLKALIASKSNGTFLELGTGIGLSLSWMVDGMDTESKLITVDNDPKLIAIANEFFGANRQVEIVCADGSVWIQENRTQQFDLVFADAWPGKYSEIDEILRMVKIGGFYVIDDMTPQSNWPEGHEDNVDRLIDYLENRVDFTISKMNWSSGVIIATRKY